MSIQVEEGLFDCLLGSGIAKEIADVIHPRLNMDGKKSKGQIVGLVDKYHIWCLLVDPFYYTWRSTMYIERSICQHAKDVVFLELDEDGGDDTRQKMLADFEVNFFICFHVHLQIITNI